MLKLLVRNKKGDLLFQENYRTLYLVDQRKAVLNYIFTGLKFKVKEID